MEDEIGIEHLHRYKSALSLVTDKVVLDIACGEGYGSALLATTANKVYGVDIDAKSVENAQKKYASENSKLSFRQGNANQIPLETDSVDVVVSFETIEHLDESNQQAFLLEIKRVLKADGLLVISTPDKANYSDRYAHENEFHIKEFTKDEFSEFLGKQFKYIAEFLQGFEVVSAITEAENSKIKDVKVCTWERPSKAFSRKYLISICSNFPFRKDTAFSSVVFDVNKDYLELTDRMVDMDAHIQELGAWGKKLDAEIAQKDKTIINQQKEIASTMERLSTQTRAIEDKCQSQADLIFNLTTVNLEKDRKLTELSELLKTKEDAIVELKINIENKVSELGAQKELTARQSQAIAALETKNNALQDQIALTSKIEKELQDSQNIIQEQKHKIHLLYQQIDSLNGRLDEIFISEGWKLLKGYYNVKGKLLPEDTNRYRIVKKAINSIRGKKEDIYIQSGLPVFHQEKVLERQPNQTISSSIARVYSNIQLPFYEYPDVSIVIPAYNAWEMNYQCINSIQENTFGVSYEVIIGDDASTDETKDIKSFIENIVVARNEDNLGFLHNCNTAAKQAKGKYILFLNNDTEVCPGWLSPLVDLMENDPTVGMTGSKLIYPDGRLQEAGGIIWNDASGWNFGHKQSPDAPEFNYVKEVDYISGASVLIRKNLWEKIGGFDTTYTPAYCEDSDLAFEVRKQGYKVLYQPLSQVVHYEGYSHGTETREGLKGTEIKAYQKLNNEKFRLKWKDVLEKDQFRNGESVFFARDRSRGKKTILVVDHYVPHYDKDAGSRTVFQYLKLFISLDFNVKFLGDNFFQHEPYTTTLQQMGIEVLYGPYYANNWQSWMKDNGENFDFILLNRPHISVKYIDFVKANTKAQILYYGHDLHFVRELKQYEIEKKPELLESSLKWREIETNLFNKADIILSPSEEEKEQIAALGIKTTVQAIKPYIFEEVNTPVSDFSNRKNILFVGGFGHKPNIDGVLWFVNEIWPAVSKDIADVKFIIVGSNAPEHILQLANDRIEVRGFVSDDELNKLYSEVRVIAVPLRFGAGVKGKTVEALNNGIPIVTTSFGVEGLPGLETFVPPHDNPVSFTNELIRIYNSSDETLARISALETDYIRENFYVDAIKANMASILKLQA
ncbi:MAG: glycosyltransferase [Nitrospirota bacterium]